MTTDLPPLREPYQASWQQRDADVMGMYLFVATELMLFGGLFAVLLFYRLAHPVEVIAASSRLNLWLGALNTAVLLTSSLFVALAGEAARAGARRPCARHLVLAGTLGLVFLAIKSVEYHDDYVSGLIPGLVPLERFDTSVQKIFMSLYFVATGLHAVHLLGGIALISGIAWRISRRRLALPEKANSVHLVGIYWHFVDVVWIFLYPALYLVRS